MNPHVIGAHLVVCIKSFYREKAAVFFTIAFPIILILVFGTVFLDQDKLTSDLHVQDLDQTPASAQLVSALALDGRFKIIPVDPTFNAAQYAKDMTLDLVLVIPSGYQRAFVQGLGLIGEVPTAAFRDVDASVTCHVRLRRELDLAIPEDADAPVRARGGEPGDARPAVHQIG